MSNVSQLLGTHLGYQPSHSTYENAQSLLNATRRKSAGEVSDLLYDAVTGLHHSARLADRLGSDDLTRLRSVVKLAMRTTPLPDCQLGLLKTLDLLCEAYQPFVGRSAGPGDFAVLNKKPLARDCPDARAKHSLVRVGGNVFENLTWMSQEELERVQDRYEPVGGLGGLAAEKSKVAQRDGRQATLYKAQLGQGGFGVIRLARDIRTDHYVAFKKSHPNGIELHAAQPKVPRLVRGLNDGSKEGIARVYGGFMAHSSSTSQSRTGKASAYSYIELGVRDLQQLLDHLVVLRFAFEGGTNLDNPVVSRIVQHLAEGASADFARQAKDRDASVSLGALALAGLASVLGDNPMEHPEKVTQFLNTLAYQMLNAVHQMHRMGIAHNDVKPDNFVFTPQGDRVALKLVDFDFASDAAASVGVPKSVYATLWAAPQVNSVEANNNGFKNDAYSTGVSIKQVNGDSFYEVLLRREAIRGNLGSKVRKPVEDRRRIDAKLTHMLEFCGLEELSDGLCHPKASKRFSIEDALGHAYFRQPGALMSDREFAYFATKLLRWSRLLQKNPIPEFASHQACAAEMAIVNKELAEKHRILRTSTRFTPAQIANKREAVEREVMQANLEELPSRLGRALNPFHWLKSEDRRDAENAYRPSGRGAWS